MIDHEESQAISGIPGLALIPGAGLLMGNRSPMKSDTQLLILATPRLARSVPGPGGTIYVGRDTSGRGTSVDH
jgi:Flp pilus assembly secretin CpaC